MIAVSPRTRRAISNATSATLALAAVNSAFGAVPGMALVLGALSTCFFLTPTLLKNSCWYGPVLNSFPTDRREVWLTIDDGPDPRQTPYILDVLRKHGVRATFFGIGRLIVQHPELCLRVLAEGHSLQNHTFHHPSTTLWAAGPVRVSRELEDCSRAIHDCTGVLPTQFRTPVGIANPFVHAAAAAQNLALIGWSATGHDGIAHVPTSVVSKITRRVRPGSIILFHESHLPSCALGSRARTLDMLLTGLKAANYTFITPLGATSSPPFAE